MHRFVLVIFLNIKKKGDLSMKKGMYQLEQVSVRLVKDMPILSSTQIREPEQAIKLLSDYLGDMDRECVCILNLKSDGTPINFHIASIGAIDSSIVSPREILKAAILSNAAKMILIHNHPSGNVKPSIEDSKITDRMIQIGELMGISLLDSIIVGGNNNALFSFKERGLVNLQSSKYISDYNSISFPKVAEKTA